MALKRVLRKAGIAAQAMPPATPQTSISGSSQNPSLSWNNSAMPPPVMAPSTSWPSAPIFQTLARKPMDSPMAQRTSGVAFTISSERP